MYVDVYEQQMCHMYTQVPCSVTEDNTYPDVLRGVDVKVTKLDDCKQLYQQNSTTRKVIDAHICTENIKAEGKSFCNVSKGYIIVSQS